MPQAVNSSASGAFVPCFSQPGAAEEVPPRTTEYRLGVRWTIGDASARGFEALRLSLVVAIGLGALPLLFAVAPDVAQAKALGVSLPWLLLGVASFPFLVLVGWSYVRLAERNEQDFTDLVRRPER